MTIAISLQMVGYISFRVAYGSCGRYDPIEDFDAEAFKGTWFELLRSKNIFFETGDCITAEYGDTEYDTKVTVTNTEVFIDEDDYSQIVGYAWASTL